MNQYRHAQGTRTKPSPQAGGLLQRACACGQHTSGGGECDSCKKKGKELQRSAVNPAGSDLAPPIVHEVLRSPGYPLDEKTREVMESHFQHDFSRVRVHTDARAAESARQVQAFAYTVGSNVTFDTAQYQPHTAQGRELIAHELAHVVQQALSPILIPAQLPLRDEPRSEYEAARASAGPGHPLPDSTVRAGHSMHSPVQVSRQRRRRRSGTAEHRIRVRWSDDEGEFYRRLLSAAARASGLREAALVQPLYELTPSFHRRYRQSHLDVRENQVVVLRFSAQYDSSQSFISAGQVQILSDEDVAEIRREETYEQERQQRVERAVQGEPTAQLLDSFLRLSPSREGVLDVIITPDNVDFNRWITRGENLTRADRQFPASTRAAVGSYADSLSALRSEYPVVYEFTFAIRGNVWVLTRINFLARVVPRTETTPEDETQREPGMARDEAEEIIADVRASRQLVLSTAAMLIAEQDPTRIENILTSVAPFAILKFGRLARTRRSARVQQVQQLLSRVRIPRAVPLRRTGQALDPELVRLARDVRVTQAGVTRQAFRQQNVATARVRVDGEIRYLDSGNTRGGAHSEEWLNLQVTEMRRSHSDVVVEQVYSERIPCRGTCGPLLDRQYPNAEIFYTTRAESAPARAAELMEQYGL